MEPVPVWEQRDNLGIGIEHLVLFQKIIQLDTLARTFLCRNAERRFRPELKEGIISLFPGGTNIEESKEWLAFFTGVIQNHDLRLTLKRHSDGCIDVVPMGINKRLGVMEVCWIYGCETREILTVVDGANDHELALGTIAIAVANAAPSIKDIVRDQGGFIATLPHGLGFAQGLAHFSDNGLLPKELAAIIRVIIPEIATA